MYLGQCAIVPDVTLVGESVANEAKFSILGVLFDGIEELITRYLAK